MSARMHNCPACGPVIQDDHDSICCPNCGEAPENVAPVERPPGCMICAGIDDLDFDYCRACGRTDAPRSAA